MNNKAVTLSLLMAIIAVFFVNSYVTSIEETTKKTYGTEVLVVSAKKDIREMETLDETMLELKTIPKKFLEPVAIAYQQKEQDKEVIKDMKNLAGSIAVVPIKKGEQITYNKITEPGMRTGLAPQVTPGRRALSIPVSEVTGVAKLVKPGDRVDVILVAGLGRSGDNKVVKTILQDVVILSVGRSVTNNVARVIEKDMSNRPRVRSLIDFDGFNSVTLEVELAQAQSLALLMSNPKNTLTLVLRNNDDTDRVNVGPMNISDILGRDIIERMQVLERAPSGK